MIKAHGLKRLHLKYQNISNRLPRQIKLWLKDEVEPIVYEGIKTRFDTEANRSEKWKALSKRTRENRIRLGYGGSHPILQRTGLLLREALGQDGLNKSSLRMGAGSAKLSFTVHSPKAWAHVTGTGKPKQNLPQRHFMTLSRKEIKRIRNSFHNFMYDELK